MESCEDACTLEPLCAVRFPWLFWGDRKVARNEQLLRSRKIAYIINCTPPCGEGGVPNFHERLSVGHKAFRYLRIPVYDTQTDTLQAHFDRVWEFMETCRTREDGNLLIHCNQGFSRSVAFVCSYLIKFEGMSSNEALSFVRQRNPLAKPNEAFLGQLRQLHEHVLKESRCGGSEPRQLSKRGWLPPSSSSRKRVAACALPNLRPQPKAMRKLGPARPPSLATALTPKDQARGSEESGYTVSSPARLLSSAAPDASDTTERDTIVISDGEETSDRLECSSVPSQVKPPVLSAQSTREGREAMTTTPLRSSCPPAAGASSPPSIINQEEVKVGVRSEAGNDFVGGKNVPCEEPSGLGSEEVFHTLRLDSEGFQDEVANEIAEGDCRDPKGAPDSEDAHGPTGVTTADPSPLYVAHGLQDATASKTTPSAKDTVCNVGLGRPRDSTLWNANRFVDLQESLQPLQATVLRVL